MIYPDVLARLIEDFKKLPGIGEKTAERMAFSVLALDEDVVNQFGKDVVDVKSLIKKCSICGSLCEGSKCAICRDSDRDNSTLCIVEDSKDVFLFEKNGSFGGKYHVLGGLISPLNGIGPEDLNLEKLVNRVKNEKISEIIVAVKGTIEGETTALYIKKIFENMNICVSRIASGIPIGAEMDYVDSLTLETAMKNRKEI